MSNELSKEEREHRFWLRLWFMVILMIIGVVTLNTIPSCIETRACVEKGLHQQDSGEKFDHKIIWVK